MGFKEEVIDLIDKCNRNIVLHPHAIQQATVRAINIDLIKEKIIKNDFIDAVPNLGERKSYRADIASDINSQTYYSVSAICGRH